MLLYTEAGRRPNEMTTQEISFFKSSGARAIIKFADDVQIVEFVRC